MTPSAEVPNSTVAERPRCSSPPDDHGIDRAVASRVQNELDRRALSFNDLADQAELSRRSLAASLEAVRPFSIAELVRVAAAIGCPLRALFPG
jgi:lambda repressor-like predicted transcriptional regulator